MRDESEDFTVRRTAYEAQRDIWIPWRRRRVESAEYYRNKLYEMVEHDPTPITTHLCGTPWDAMR